MRRIAILFGFCCLTMLVLAGNAPAGDSKGGQQLGVAPAPVHNNGSALRTMALAGNRPALKLLSAPADTCIGEDDTSASVSGPEQAMERMINFARQQAGLPKL